MAKRNRNRRAQRLGQVAQSTTKDRMIKEMGKKIKKAKKQQEAAAAQQQQPTVNLPVTVQQYQLIEGLMQLGMKSGDTRLLLPLAQLQITMQEHGATFVKEMQRKAARELIEQEEGGKKSDKDETLRKKIENVTKATPANDDEDEDEDEEDGEEEAAPKT